MPRVSEFYGIVIYMYPGDHPPPHFHAIYAGEQAMIRIEDGNLITGTLPPRALALVRAWARLRRVELSASWARADAGLQPHRIAPLD